jgi:signal transduction histidine kinase
VEARDALGIEDLPAAVVLLDVEAGRGRALTSRARQVSGAETFELDPTLPGLAARLQQGETGGLYESPGADCQAWTFSATAAPGGYLVTLVEALPFLEERSRHHRLNEAVLEITAEHSEERLLERIIETARELAGAQYGALGVFGLDRRLRRFITSGLTREEEERIGPLPVGQGILGILRFTDRPIRIADIAKDPRSHGFPPGHPEMHSFLGVPMLLRGGNVGNIYLTEKVGAAEFSDEDEAVIQALAAHAALAVENARLLGQLRDLAVTEERERIRRDLHDGVIQAIYALGLQLELVESDAEGEVRDAIGSAVDSVETIIKDLRAFISGLHPAMLSSSSFEAGLAAVLAESSLTGLVVQSNLEAEAADALTPEAQLHTLQFIREALSNVRRHAGATTASVSVSRAGESLKVSVVDNGRGFDPHAARSLGSQGLVHMTSRAEALAGSLFVRSAPGSGTTVEMRFPAPQPAPAVVGG